MTIESMFRPADFYTLGANAPALQTEQTKVIFNRRNAFKWFTGLGACKSV